MAAKIIYFGSDPNSPFALAAKKRTEILCFAPNDDVSDVIHDADAAIIDCMGEERQTVLKVLLKEKKPFALCGLAGETPDSLKKLCAAAKRRHIQICWMGSYRFEWAMAKMRETVVSGCLGTIQQVRLTKRAAAGIFERLRDSDLLNGLLAGNDVAFTYENCDDDSLSVCVSGSCGCAVATLHPGSENEFSIQLLKSREASEKHLSNPAEAELGCLIFAIERNLHWTLLGKVPN